MFATMGMYALVWCLISFVASLLAIRWLRFFTAKPALRLDAQPRATVLQFPAPVCRPNVERLLPLLNAIPDDSVKLVEAVLLGSRLLDRGHGAGLTQQRRQAIADSLFMVY